MREERLCELLDLLPDVRILVVGDFFLDRYLIIDPVLAEVSLETGLEAHQVVRVRNSPGAAGTVTNNLRALDVQVTALGIIGKDGMAFELLRHLENDGVDVTYMVGAEDRLTPTYIKPMSQRPDGPPCEMSRMDIKNRTATPKDLEKRLIELLRSLCRVVDGVIVADQVPEANCGAITDRVRGELDYLSREYPEKIMAADSRQRIGAFRNLIIKPNEKEALKAVESREPESEYSLEKAGVCGQTLYDRNRRPVFVTVGPQGILVFDETGMTHTPAVRVSGPIDIVGAGDSAMAGIVSALCAGATPVEAAEMANLIASLTIQQLGTTGTASRKDALRRFREASARGSPG